MRTKILCAAALAAGALTTMAQVYSANIVGYYNVPTTGNGAFTLTANQFTNGDNTLNAVLPAAGYGDEVLTFANNNYNIDIFDGSEWLDNNSGNPSTTVVPPGVGFFYANNNADAAVTFVGQVPTGTLNLPIPSGFTLAATPVPAVLDLASNSFPQIYGLQILTFANNNYTVYINDGTEWLDNNSGNPVALEPAVGQGYFIDNSDATTYNWTLNFNP